MDYFNESDIRQLLTGYEKSIVALKTDTYKQYRDMISDFLRNIVLNKIERGKYPDIFSEDNIIRFRKIRKSIVVRSALNKFLSYLINEGLVNKGFEFEFNIEERSKNVNDFLTISEIKYIFEQATFDSYEAQLFSQAICALACFCFFEQHHIKVIKLSDVLLDSNLIRNMRAIDEDDPNTSFLLKWIKLNDIASEYLNRYINEYRLKLETDLEELFIWNGKPLSNDPNGVNTFLYPFLRKANKDNISKVNIQLLYSSTILYWLISTQGKALSKILQIIEAGNVQWKRAFKYYMENYALLENAAGVLNITDFTIIEKGNMKEEQQLNDYINSEPSDDVTYEDILFNLIPYSERDDINVDDLLDFDAMNRNNLSDKEITINRLVRDTTISKRLKNLYNNKCQLCGYQLRSSSGDYMSEAHHIKPYNRTHQGDDTIKNIIILCPNCHAQFDQLYYAINPETFEVHCLFEDDRFHLSPIEIISGHKFGKEYLEYAMNLFLEKSKNI